MIFYKQLLRSAIGYRRRPFGTSSSATRWAKVVGGEKIESQLANAYSTLGPDVYAGTSGVALFLGELYSCTGDTQARETASGAIRHALAKVDEVPPADRAGLFSGWTGIALAAARLSRTLEQPELAEMARSLLRKKILMIDNLDSFDILSGKAGAIVACIILYEILGDPEKRSDSPFTWEMGQNDRTVPC